MAPRHPDADLAAAIIADLGAWLALEPTDATPTSVFTGGGAFAAAESELSRRVGGRPATLVPNATYGLRVALAAVGVGPGDEVLVPGLDWPATFAAVSSLGARAVAVPVDTATLTISPSAAAASAGRLTRAAVACHIRAIPADVPALQRALPGVALVEDCSQALGSRLDSAPVGTMGDVAVFSFGPAKALSAGEIAAVVSRDAMLNNRVVALAAHPSRQVHAGLSPRWGELSMRADAVSAMRLAVKLRGFDPTPLISSHRAACVLLTQKGLVAAGADARREVAEKRVHAWGRAVDAADLEQWMQDPIMDIQALIVGGWKQADIRALPTHMIVRPTHGIREDAQVARYHSGAALTRRP